ncbi:MAG TPA: hypothetical protein VIJ51_17205 [Solirubrobacteraceae bacterium]
MKLLASREPPGQAIAGRLLGRVAEHDGHDGDDGDDGHDEARVDDDAHRRGSTSTRA